MSDEQPKPVAEWTEVDKQEALRHQGDGWLREGPIPVWHWLSDGVMPACGEQGCILDIPAPMNILRRGQRCPECYRLWCGTSPPTADRLKERGARCDNTS